MRGKGQSVVGLKLVNQPTGQSAAARITLSRIGGSEAHEHGRSASVRELY